MDDTHKFILLRAKKQFNRGKRFDLWERRDPLGPVGYLSSPLRTCQPLLNDHPVMGFRALKPLNITACAPFGVP